MGEATASLPPEARQRVEAARQLLTYVLDGRADLADVAPGVVEHLMRASGAE